MDDRTLSHSYSEPACNVTTVPQRAPELLHSSSGTSNEFIIYLQASGSIKCLQIKDCSADAEFLTNVRSPKLAVHVPHAFFDSVPSKAVFLNRRAAARYQALASIIPGRERFSWSLSF